MLSHNLPDTEGVNHIRGVLFSAPPETKTNAEIQGTGLTKDNKPPTGGEGSGSEPPSDSPKKGVSRHRHWAKTAGATMAFLGLGWTVSSMLRGSTSSKDKENHSDASKPAIATVVDGDDLLFARFEEGGDLQKIAYQFIDNGIFSYRFPVKLEAASDGDKTAQVSNQIDKGQTHADSQVSGFVPGEAHEAFILRLRASGVEIKSGKDWQTETDQQLKLEILNQEKDIAQMEENYKILRTLLSWGLFTGLIVYGLSRFKKMSKNGIGLPFTRTGTYGDVLTERPKDGFDHIGGLQHVIPEFEYLRDDIKLRQRGEADVELPKGILLFGDPGTGKTMLARALASETDCPFVSFKGSELSTEFFVGSGVAKVRQAFIQARELRDKHTEELRKKGNKKCTGDVHCFY